MSSNRRYQEALGILIILFSIILLLSFFSYNAKDLELLNSSRPLTNIMGSIGVYLGDYLRGAFGYAAYIFSIVFGIAGWGILKKGKITDYLDRLFSLFYVMIVFSVLLSLMSKNTIPHFSGGYIGVYLSRFFISIFNRTGTYIIVIILNLIGLVLLGIVSLSTVFTFVYKKNTNISSLIKSIFRRIFLFKIRKKVPLNNIENAVKGRKKKMPWIVKKSVKSREDKKEESSEWETLKFIQLKEPVSIKKDISDNLYVEDFTPTTLENIDIETSYTFKNEYEFGYEQEDDYFETVDSEIIEGKEALPIDDMKDEITIINDFSQQKRERDGISESFDEFDDNEDIFSQIESNRISSVILDDEIDLKEEDEEQYLFEFEGLKEEEYEEMKPASNTLDTRSEAKVLDWIRTSNEYDIPVSYLDTSASIDMDGWRNEAEKTSMQLIKTLGEFGIQSRIINVNRGPVITLYEMQIAPGIKVNRIVGLADDIAMALAASRVRIVAPIPGKSAIGVEVPNADREIVTLGDIVNSTEYQSQRGSLKVGLGKDILGKRITIDIKKMPHLLIAGATGAGKSVCVNSIITSLLYNYDPDYVRFILVDPKMVELQLYNGLPHLITPVITESYLVPKALKWVMCEMERRYRLLSEINTRDIVKYNDKIKRFNEQYEKLPYIVIIIDELADLMMMAAKEIEGFITRIAQKARAVGIHLVLATQRPSVDIITGVIKANFPARIAFQVAQKTDSRTIIDQNGAEKLLGKGDMLYQSPVSSFPIRVQGAFISEEEIINIVRHIKKLGKPKYLDIEDDIFDSDDGSDDIDNAVEDSLFVEALKIVEETRKASASYLQRRLSIGYNRAARIIELMEDRGYIGPQQGSKAREVYI